MAHHHFDWKPAFLAALRELPVIAHACKAVGIERSTAYRAREADQAFADAWDDAMEEGIDRAEQEAVARPAQAPGGQGGAAAGEGVGHLAEDHGGEGGDRQQRGVDGPPKRLPAGGVAAGAQASQVREQAG